MCAWLVRAANAHELLRTTEGLIHSFVLTYIAMADLCTRTLRPCHPQTGALDRLRASMCTYVVDKTEK